MAGRCGGRLLLLSLLLATALFAAAAPRPSKTAAAAPLPPTNFTSRLKLFIRALDLVDPVTGAVRAALPTGVQLQAQAAWHVTPPGSAEQLPAASVSVFLDPIDSTTTAGMADTSNPAANVSVTGLWTRSFFYDVKTLPGVSAAAINTLTRTLTFTEPTCSYIYSQVNISSDGLAFACNERYAGRLVAAPLRFTTANFVAGAATGSTTLFRGPLVCMIDPDSKTVEGNCSTRPAGIPPRAWPPIPVATSVEQQPAGLALAVEAVDAVADGRVVRRHQPNARLVSNITGGAKVALPNPYTWAYSFTGTYASSPGGLRLSGLNRSDAANPRAQMGVSGLALDQTSCATDGNPDQVSALLPGAIPKTPIVFAAGGECTYVYKQAGADGAMSCRISWAGKLNAVQLASPLFAAYSASAMLSFPQLAPLVCNLDLSSKTIDPAASNCV